MIASAVIPARPLSAPAIMRARDESAVDVSAADAPPPAPQAIAATPPQQDLLPARLVIELDSAASRFVQTLVDGTGETVLRRYPDEAQLAFSRGVNAYMTAMARR